MSDETLRKAAQRLSDAIADKAASVGLGWKGEMDTGAEYRAALVAVRAALSVPAPTVDAAALDVERLAKALRVVFVADAETGEPPSDETLRGFARDVLAALRASAPGDETHDGR